MKPKRKQHTNSEISLLKFIKKTKRGKLAKITQEVSPYARMEILREEPSFDEEENYYYSTR